MMGERRVRRRSCSTSSAWSVMSSPTTSCVRSTGLWICRVCGRTCVPSTARWGRPSIDPELMIRMLIVGYCFGIWSERRLCNEAHLNLAYRWFCRLGLEGAVPDHSTFSKNRHGRFRDSDLLRELFETTVRRCIDEGLVGGEDFAIDASLTRADPNRQRSADGSEAVDWNDLTQTRRSVCEYLDTLDEAAWGAASEVTPRRRRPWRCRRRPLGATSAFSPMTTSTSIQAEWCSSWSVAIHRRLTPALLGTGCQQTDDHSTWIRSVVQAFSAG